MRLKRRLREAAAFLWRFTEVAAMLILFVGNSRLLKKAYSMQRDISAISMNTHINIYA